MQLAAPTPAARYEGFKVDNVGISFGGLKAVSGFSLNTDLPAPTIA